MAHSPLGKQRKTKNPNALTDIQGTLLFVSVPQFRVGEEGEKTTKRLLRRGVSHAQNSRACSAINHRTRCLQTEAAAGSSPHSLALQAMPVPTNTHPGPGSCPPAPAGLDQTHKSINSNRTAINHGWATVVCVWFSSKMQLSQE